MAEDHVLGEGIIEHAPSGANHRLSLSTDVVGKSYARGEIVVVGVVKPGRTASAATHPQQRTAGRGLVNSVEQVVLFAGHAEVIPAQAHGHSQARGPAKAVLDVETFAIFKFVAAGVAGGLASARRDTFYVRYEIGEAELAAEVGVLGDGDAGSAELIAELHIVAADLPRIVVDEVPVGIHAIAGNTGAGAEFGKIPHRDERQSIVKRADA